jgi:hypothetical protein
MWDCDKCGTTAIAGSVAVCPHCGADRPVAPTSDVSSDSAAQGGQEPDGNSAPEGSAPGAESDDTDIEEEDSAES